ncbi:MAG: TonB-dependent receptor [Candidatus Solibacter usitatus]|nr:TonB-dependent receptor [Candidatus Solibacter usitatus]
MKLRLTAFVTLLAASLLGQSRGTISGEVVDASGALVPGAKVTVSAPSIGLTRETTSNDNGYFTVVTLPVGNYDVKVEAAGFKTLTRTAVRLDADAVLLLKLQLEVGQLTEKVEVTTDAPMVETSNGEVSRMITRAQLQNFALPGRNPFYMLGIMPGVISRYGNFMTDFRGGSFSMGGLQINGQRKDMNFITVDGINNGRNRDGVQQNSIMGVDFIEEVKVHTTHYAPEYGRSTGAQINFTTRRGTQDFHAAGYEFFFAETMAACPYVVGCAAKPRIRYHNFGFNVGGPVYIPGKWNTEKNKLFFFAGLEARRNSGSNQKMSVVPTALERGGNFSASAIKPIDPDTGQPFPNHIIPASRISNMGKSLQKMYPDPNYTGPGGNYYAFRAQPTTSNDIIYRLDYNIKPNWQLSFRALPGRQEFTSVFDNTGNNIPLFEAYRDRRGNNYVLTLNTVINPTTINELSYGYSDYREDFRLIGDGLKRSTWGFTFPEVFPGNRMDRIPNISITGFQGFSGSGHPSFARTPTFILRENFSKIMGSHTLKAGLYWEWMNMNELNQANDNGSFGFGSSASNPKNSGNPWANALLGNFDGYGESSSPVQTIYKSFAREFYVQDSWRMSRRFSLEYGLRWSFIAPWYARDNNLVAFMAQYWDPAKAPQVAANGSIVPGTGDLYNGLVLPGSGWPDSAKGRIPQVSDAAITAMFRGVPRGFNPLRKNNFQPRLSFAWDVLGDGKLAVRAGAGIFHGVTGIANSGWYLGAREPLVSSTSISNGFADNPASGIPNTTRFPIGSSSLPYDYAMPTMYNYSVGIQTLLPFKTQLDVSYVGNSGRHLSYSRPINFLTPEVQAANQGVDLRRFLPYRGLSGMNIVEPSSTSSYNSMQMAVRRRTGNLTYALSYTLGKIIGYGNEGIAGGMQNPLNMRAERSELEESRRHYMVLSHTYELPWYKTQQGFLGRILGGWSVSGVWTITSGRLFMPSLTGVARQVASRPDVVGEWYMAPDKRSLFQYFNTAAFARPKDWTYGNSGKWVIRGPGSIDLSAFALKDIRVVERVKVQLRLETFNALNHMNLGGFNTQLGNRAFGQINDVGAPRYLQIGGKVMW